MENQKHFQIGCFENTSYSMWSSITPRDLSLPSCIYFEYFRYAPPNDLQIGTFSKNSLDYGSKVKSMTK